uniref:Uncharacterized protein n=1 Tax=Anguilla anguilla TaxID=7936 RepID=A0A0E9PT94_ANGAN
MCYSRLSWKNIIPCFIKCTYAHDSLTFRVTIY